jgi:signal transduction histidine kinase
MGIAGERAPRGGDTAGRRKAFWTVAAFTVALVLMSLLQFRVILGLPLRPIMLALPAIAGVTFGALVASIRAARARERFMAGLLAAAQESRFEAMARLAGGIGHDLGNVFAVATSCSGCVREVAARKGAGACGGCVAAIDDLDAALERARGISRQLVMLSRPAGAPAAPMDAAASARELAPVLRRVLGGAVRLEVLAPEAAHVRIDRTELEQILLNLAANSRDAMPRGGTLSIRVARDGAGVLLSVRDTGSGMSEGTRAHMFEPFFTTKPPGKGTGLGLMVVALVVQRAQASVAVRSAPGEGTEVTIVFPGAPAAPSPVARAI